MTVEQSGTDLATVGAGLFLYLVFFTTNTANFLFVDEEKGSGRFMDSSDIEQLPYAEQCSECWEYTQV